jgi:hypothetical protein
MRRCHKGERKQKEMEERHSSLCLLVCPQATFNNTSHKPGQGLLTSLTQQHQDAVGG